LPGGHLLGRERERDAVDRLLDAGRAGRGGVLVVHGEAGIGKTALLECALEAGREFRVARIFGVEIEMELAFAALQRLCCPYLKLMEHLPEPQRDALAVAFGLGAGPAPNPFLVGLAVLGLLAEVAEERPLLCVIDDAQWLDTASARALAFVGRRLLAEKITLVFATRELGQELRGLPDLEVRGLCDGAASALLSSVVPFLLDEQVRGRIVSETRGNPLALLELPRALTPAQLAGGLGLVCCCCWRPRIRSATRCCCGARPRSSESRPGPPMRWRPTACSRSESKSPSDIRWCAPRCTGQPRLSKGELSIPRWRR
jgi:hypothetical protein